MQHNVSSVSGQESPMLRLLALSARHITSRRPSRDVAAMPNALASNRLPMTSKFSMTMSASMHCPANPACAAAAEGGAAAAAAAPAATPDEPKLSKKKVAMHVGYEGTAYRGLQMQEGQATEDTIEDVLRQAIFAAGGILPSNLDDLKRLRWSRSSRTDKRVHSLSTVVALKMECDPDSFNEDPDGVGIAAAINAHLPPAVRVFSVQRVTKRFDARTECVSRTYHYYLPASVLGLAGDGGAADEATLALLSQAWGCYSGSHGFHNYTRRRLYRGPAYRSSAKGRMKGGRAGVSDSSVSAGDDEEEEEVEDSGEAGVLGAASLEPGSGGEDTGDEAAAAAPRGKVQLAWKVVPDAADLVGQRHRRYMEECTASGLTVLVPGGRPCVRLTVRGASFMLHQIRHQVGGAVAVALGRLPLEALRASLATPARVSLPLAPPSTLVLSGAEFGTFRTSWDHGKAPACAEWTGDRLTLRAPGAALQARFAQEALLPAVDELLGGGEWEEWRREVDRIWFDPEEMADLLGHYDRHVQRARERREQREAERGQLEAAAAQAAEAESRAEQAAAGTEDAAVAAEKP